MKLMIVCICGLLSLLLPSTVTAQNDQSTTQKVKEGTKKGAQEVKEGVKRGAHEVAQQASEAKAEVTDKEVEDKMGPSGEDIFLDDDNRYYYIDQKGHRVYVRASLLKNKPPKKKD